MRPKLKLTLDFLELMVMSKKKVLSIIKGSFFTNLVGGGYRLFYFFKCGLMIINIGKPWSIECAEI